MKKGKLCVFVATMLIGLLLSTGCVSRVTVNSWEVGVHTFRGKIVKVEGPGLVRDPRPRSAMVKIDLSTKAVLFEDPDLGTQDNSQIGIKVRIEYRRMGDEKSIAAAWRLFNREMRDDGALAAAVLSRAAEAAKDVTTGHTINEIVGSAEDADRSATSGEIHEKLAPALEKIYIELVNIAVENITPPEQWVAVNQAKTQALAEQEMATARARAEETRVNAEANAKVVAAQAALMVAQKEAEAAIERTAAEKAKAVAEAEAQTVVLKERLEQERATSKIDLEIADREQQKAEMAARVFDNEGYREFRMAELYAQAIAGAGVIYLPADAIISLGNVQPVVPVE